MQGESEKGRALGKGKSPHGVTLETCIGGSMQDSKKGELWGKAKVLMEFRKSPVSEVRCKSQRRQSSGERQKSPWSSERDLFRRFDAGVKEGGALGKGKRPDRVTIATCFGGSMQESKKAELWGKAKAPIESRLRPASAVRCRKSKKGELWGKAKAPIES